MAILLSRDFLSAMRRVFKTSSFRIVISFVGFFLVSGMIVTIVTGFHNQHLFEREIRQVVTNEGEETFAAAGHPDLDHFLPVVKALVHNEPGFFYLLEDKTQTIVAGNMLHLRPVSGPRWLSWSHRIPRPPRPIIVYGEGYQLSDGGYYFVGIDASRLHQLRRDLWCTVAWSSVAFIVLGLIGGILLSGAVLARIEAISVTARSIMNGNVMRRIPLQGTDDEFDHLSHSLNVMLDQNQALITSLQQVSNDIAHDMRSPLARLRHRLEKSLERESTMDAVKENISLSIDDLDCTLETFTSLLSLAQIESGMQREKFVHVDLVALARNITETYLPVLEERHQRLDVSLPTKAMILGLPVLLRQVFANLLENASQHTPQGSKIMLGISVTKEHLQILVSDNGTGIPDVDLKRVFDRFVRLEHSRSMPGNGLGLSIVRAIIQRHSGTILLTNNMPGLRCTIDLPRFHSS
ncbi:sensor histidine kinase KdpD [Acetobacter estunensis]|uniref:sensor histidine kinase n=1 Tax=Acetobacter estunensis TaxID=104097 RepID=UPI001C2DB8AA|nr:HAMP domain-containing sensor histidine kinase [Acetobacter estunensis]MBV1838529.1 HAMP domain-containing histidine kinase [Acetobacter estunensis]